MEILKPEKFIATKAQRHEENFIVFNKKLNILIFNNLSLK